LDLKKTSGFKTVYANDFDKYCKVIYDLNFETIKLDYIGISALKTQSLPKYDVFLGGFPCQAFSIAGYRKGFEDEKGRGNLFFEINRIIKDTHPITFFLENVKNLEKHDKGRTFKIISDRLAVYGSFKVFLNNLCMDICDRVYCFIYIKEPLIVELIKTKEFQD